MSISSRKVTFHSKTFVRGIPELSTYSSEEISGLWYGRQEFMSIMEETRKIVVIMVTGDVESMDDGYCKRGLEIRSGKRADLRRRLKLEALNGEFPALLHFSSLKGHTEFLTRTCNYFSAVLDVQEKNRKTGIDKPEAIATAYESIARSCHDAAHLAGIKDEKEAQKIFKETMSSPDPSVRKFRKRLKIKPPRRHSSNDQTAKMRKCEDGGQFRRHSYCNLVDAKKTVTFSRQTKTRSVPHIKDISKEDICKLWYQPTEIRVMSEEQKHTAQLVEKFSCYQDTDTCAVRGCEVMIQENIRKRKRSQTIARSAVFNEQIRQAQRGKHDPEQLAAAYRAAATRSVQEAQRMGQRDELDVLAIAAEDRVLGMKRTLEKTKDGNKRRFSMKARKQNGMN